MSKRDLFSELQEAVGEFQEYDKSARKLKAYEVAEPDVKKIRETMGLSQRLFATMLSISTSTLQNWEQGIRRPTGPAKALLKIVEVDPRYAMKALHP